VTEKIYLLTQSHVIRHFKNWYGDSCLYQIRTKTLYYEIYTLPIPYLPDYENRMAFIKYKKSFSTKYQFSNPTTVQELSTSPGLNASTVMTKLVFLQHTPRAIHTQLTFVQLHLKTQLTR